MGDLWLEIYWIYNFQVLN